MIQIDFILEAFGNTLPLLTSIEAINAFNDAPPEIWTTLEAAGFGRSQHDSQTPGGSHLGYNKRAVGRSALTNDNSDTWREATFNLEMAA
ncbi:MAG: hypothetical protein ABJF50_25350 [Paracoccaceae bacterium]|uniref:hypothetical protein n=1 Tax=Hyphomonas sp. TaxID=87 RepID=UPI00326FB312